MATEATTNAPVRARGMLVEGEDAPLGTFNLIDAPVDPVVSCGPVPVVVIWTPCGVVDTVASCTCGAAETEAKRAATKAKTAGDLISSLLYQGKWWRRGNAVTL
jgi:hypothetical protein